MTQSCSSKCTAKARSVFRRVDVERSTDLCDRRVIPEQIGQNLCVCAVHAALVELQSVVAAEIPNVFVRVHEGSQGVFRDPVSPGMHLFDTMISRGRAPAGEQHRASLCVSGSNIHMHTETSLRDAHIAQNTPTNAQIRLTATI